MKKIDVGFLGYGTRAIDALMADDRFNVKYFLAPRSRLCSDVLEAAEKYKARVTLEIIDTKRELSDRIKSINDVRCFVMNACPFILTDEILSHMDFYNIHPGDLRTNRGHQPHLWSVLLGERKTRICLHKVNSQIDLGEIIEDAEVELEGKENAAEVLNMAEDMIPFLLDGLYRYLMGEKGIKYTVRQGDYRPTMTFSDYEITPSDSPSDIDRKIRARAMHSGAFFLCENKRLYVNRIISAEASSEESLSFDGKYVIYCHSGFKLTLAFKKATDLNGNITAGDIIEINRQ